MTTKTSYEYVCSNGHEVSAPSARPDRCPVYRHGSPCDGGLSPLNVQARKARKAGASA